MLDLEILREGTESFELGFKSHPLLETLEIDISEVKIKRRQTCLKCIDWSERVPHVAGPFGAALAKSLENISAIERSPDDRSVSVTPFGYEFLEKHLGITKGRIIS